MSPPESADRITVEDWDYAVLVAKRLLTERQHMCMALNRAGASSGAKRWARQGVTDLELVLRVLKDGNERMTHAPQVAT